MLVLTRKVGERIHIGNNIVVTVVRIQNDKVRLGIDAPSDVAIHREEVFQRVEASRLASPTSETRSVPSAVKNPTGS
jgi:carbon storage regulator